MRAKQGGFYNALHLRKRMLQPSRRSTRVESVLDVLRAQREIDEPLRSALTSGLWRISSGNIRSGVALIRRLKITEEQV